MHISRHDHFLFDSDSESTLSGGLHLFVLRQYPSGFYLNTYTQLEYLLLIDIITFRSSVTPKSVIDRTSLLLGPFYRPRV